MWENTMELQRREFASSGELEEGFLERGTL